MIDLTLLVKYIKTYLDIIIKTSKYSKVIETVAQNGSLKNISKILKNFQENTSAGVYFLNKTKREKGNSSTVVFPRVVLTFFGTLLLKVVNRWLLLKALSRITHQNLVNF